MSGYSGNATDALAPTGSLSWASASGRPFSTFDVDNDEAITLNCATLTGGGWWQNQCSSTELNARYGSVDETLGRPRWLNVKDQRYMKMNFVEMKIKLKG